MDYDFDSEGRVLISIEWVPIEQLPIIAQHIQDTAIAVWDTLKLVIKEEKWIDEKVWLDDEHLDLAIQELDDTVIEQGYNVTMEATADEMWREEDDGTPPRLEQIEAMKVIVEKMDALMLIVKAKVENLCAREKEQNFDRMAKKFDPNFWDWGLND